MTWNPGRLDQILSILGNGSRARLQRRTPGSAVDVGFIHMGANQVQRRNRRARERKPLLRDSARYSRGDSETKRDPHRGGGGAAYRSEEAWRTDTGPAPTPDADPESMPVMEALIQIPRPLMLPPADGNRMDKLRAAVDLSLSPGYRDARHAYFTWFRDFMEPLRGGNQEKVRTRLDHASIIEAQNRLRELWAQEVAAAKAVDKERWGSRVEFGCMSLGALGGMGLAAAAALPAIGVPVAIMSFAGWAARRLTAPQPPP